MSKSANILHARYLPIKHSEMATSTRDLLGDTHCVFTLADKRLYVTLSLRPDGDQLKCVGPGTELPVGWLHLTTGAVGQVDASNWLLERHGSAQRNKQKIKI
jgi:hypothetical protein